MTDTGLAQLYKTRFNAMRNSGILRRMQSWAKTNPRAVADMGTVGLAAASERFPQLNAVVDAAKLYRADPVLARELMQMMLVRQLQGQTPTPPQVGMTKQQSVKTDVAEAAKKVDPSPSAMQKEVGNYKKGHVTVNGLDITIETAKGGVRSGVTAEGKPWRTVMKAHYGYIKKTESEADGDHVDVFLGPDPASFMVFVIDQVKPGNGHFDEHKCVMGCHTADEAKDLYHANYQAGWKGFSDIRALSLGEFKDWLEKGDTGRPIAEQFEEAV